MNILCYVVKGKRITISSEFPLITLTWCVIVLAIEQKKNNTIVKYLNRLVTAKLHCRAHARFHAALHANDNIENCAHKFSTFLSFDPI